MEKPGRKISRRVKMLVQFRLRAGVSLRTCTGVV